MAAARKTLTCIVVDDEMPAHHSFRQLIKLEGSLRLVGSCFNAFEAMDKIREKQQDIVFLNVQMPVVTGIEMLELIPEAQFMAVIVTVMPRSHVQMTDKRIKGFLNKPVTVTKFGQVARRLLMLTGFDQSKP